eukprot:TRINITY_DN36_c0_g2_i3.p1 TRINITY_DN36_c0_g2~~TRINITY_DN36_c0_g2_i3.p1  ORF type:complete len:578 (+),score=240.06 TRINITY_DN36_c0_g2_i3:89-1822(+)
MPAKKRAALSGGGLSEAQLNALGLGGVVLLAALFAAAYHFGAGRQAEEGSQRTQDLKQRVDYTRDTLKKCQNRTRLSREHTHVLQGEGGEVWQRNKRLEEENNRLVRLNEELEKRNIECVENSELTKHRWRDEDNRNAERLSALDQENRLLRSQSKRLRGTQGMRTIILLATVKKLAQEMATLRQSLKLPAATIDSEFIDSLVVKWMEIDSAARAKGQVGPLSHHSGEVLPPNKSEMWSGLRRPSVLEQFDPDRRVRSMFVPKRGATGWRLPCWNERCGTQDVRHGTYVGSRLAPITDVNRQMRVLYEYALCAVGNNITKFMYPTSFKRCKSCHTEYVHNYIETPLVLFCDDCRPQHNTNTFKLLCAGNTAEQLYGSELFWRMRSRLRFKGRFFNIAYDWLDENRFGVPGGRLKGSRTLAVRLPRGEEWAKACNAAREAKRPVLSYSKLLKAKDGVVEHSDDHDEQCMPPWSVVYSKINARAAWLAKDGGDAQVKVYISSGPGSISDAEWYDLQTNVNYPIFRRLSHGRPTEDDIVDSLIAACSERLILNRFDIKSSIILEAYQLWNSLMVGGTHVW